METVLEGIVIGVSSGIVLGFVFWLTNFVKARSERRDQVKYLSKEIAKFRDLILQAKDLEVQLGAKRRQYTRSQVQKSYYEDMRRQVDRILVYRASRLSSDEINSVRNVFFTDLYPGVELNDSGYEGVFTDLETLKWLRLPPRIRSAKP